METEAAGKKKRLTLYLQFAVGAALLAVLYVISRQNYLLFHGIAEIFSSLVAFTIFVLAWHTRRYTDNDFLLFLGIAYLFIGMLDLMHMLAYTGMGVFEGYGTDLPTQLWIATRYIEAASLLLSPLFLTRKLRAWLDVAAYTAVTALVLLSIFAWDIFPSCFVEGAGLTPFKRISEYVISLMLLGAIAFIFSKRGEFDPKVFRLMVASIALTVVSELCFTLYQDPYGFFNLLGHFFKIVSFYLIYRAIVDTGLEEPYELLFRRLKERERRERAILDATADSLFLYDLEGKILAINEVAARNLGKSADELVGTDLAELLPPPLAEKTRAVMDEMLSESVSVRREEEYEGKWYENSFYPVLDRDGGVVMLAVYSRDITERRRIEQALRQSEERFRELVEGAPVSVVIFQDGGIVYVNPANVEMTGYSLDEQMAMDPMEILHPDYREEVSSYAEARMEGGDIPPRYDIRIMTRDGQERWWSLSVAPIDFEDRPAILGIGVDITESRKAREALAESRERWQRSFDAIGDVMMVIDGEQRILQHNDALCELLGREGDFTGRRCYELIHGLDEPPDFCVCVEAMACRKRVRKEIYESNLDKHLWVSLSPVFDERGEMEFGVHVIQDISERKRAEEHLRRYSFELEERVKELDCLFGVSRIIEIPELTLDEILARVVEILPPAWRYPEVACARITLDGREFATADFEQSDWGLKSDIDMFGERAGRVEVYYRGEKPPHESPFLEEEKGLLDAVAERLGRVAERKEMIEQLRMSEEKHRNIVEQSSDGIVMVDGEGVVVEWNSAQEDIMGIKRDEALGRYLWDVQYGVSLPDRKTPATYENLKKRTLRSLQEDYTTWTGETREQEIRSADGRNLIIQAVTFPIHSRDSLMMGSITRDITQRVLMEEALGREVEVNRALAELSRALLAQASIEDVSDEVLEKARNLTGSPYGYVGYIETETGHVISPTLTREIWEECEVADKSVVFEDFRGLWGWVLKNKKPLLSNAPAEDPRSTGVPAGHIPIERFLSVPALLGGALVGQISVANSSRDYTERDADVLSRLADLYAMAVLRMWSEGELEKYREHLEDLVKERTLELERINRQLQEEVAVRERNQEELVATAERLRALSARLESVREEERRRVALEVHDTLGQALTGLKINLSLLGKKVAGEGELEERIEGMNELIDSTIQSVREISTELRPGVLDDLGLAAALEWQLNRFAEITGLECSFVSHMEQPLLDKELNVALFRITQEALTNVARHASASRVDVLLAQESHGVSLKIMDDGRGITDSEMARSGSLGILGMRERAHLFDGEVEIKGESGKGTTLAVRIPWVFQHEGDGKEDGL